MSRPGALFAAWGYDWLECPPDVEQSLVHPFREIIDPFWAPQNRILWNGYRQDDIAIPLPRLHPPNLAIDERWSVRQLVEYMQTWSAYKLSRRDPYAVKRMDAVLSRMGPVDRVVPVRMPLKLVCARLP